MGEKNENSKIGIMIDGEFKEIKPISAVSLDMNNNCVDTEPIENYAEYFKGGSIGFELDKMSAIEMVRKLSVFTDFEPLHHYTNNWRKLHGLPMRRRCKQ